MTSIRHVTVTAINPGVPQYRYTAQAPAVFTTTTIVRVLDSDGLVGTGGYDSDTVNRPDLAPLETLRSVAPVLLGKDIWSRIPIEDELTEHWTAATEPGPVSAIDIALWDLAGQHLELPVHRLLGNAREEVQAYAALPFVSDLGQYLELVGSAVSCGYRAVKVHVSGEPRADIALAEAIRASHPDLNLMVDAEGMYDRRAASRVVAALADIGVRWLEAPLPDWDLEGYRRLCRASAVTIIPAGGAIWDLRAFAAALADPPWDAMRSDVTTGGGITFGQRLADLARAFSVDVEFAAYGHTLAQAANLQVILGLGASSYYEQAFPVEAWEFGVINPIVADSNGIVRGSEDPGLGVRLDTEAIGSATIGEFHVGEA